MKRWLLILFLLLPAVVLAAQQPTILRVVDLRWIEGQPELETWLGCLQGLLNRQDDNAAVFVVRDDIDAAQADSLVSMYRLRRETLTPGALLEDSKAKLAGQVLYDPTQPWTRNIALTAAAVQPGMVIATDADLGLRTVLDLRGKWPEHREAYAWAQAQFIAKTDRTMFALAPENANLLADWIMARKLLAVDLSPQPGKEADLLAEIIESYPVGGRIIGDAGGGAQAWDNVAQLSALARKQNLSIVPARNSSNLSCFVRFSATRPLVQGRDEAAFAGSKPLLTFVYTGGTTPLRAGGSVDYATNTLWLLLNDPSLTGLPVGIETPIALFDYAPGLYQALLARQRLTAAEMIGAAGTEMVPNCAAAMDLQGVSLALTGNEVNDKATVARLLASGVRGAFVPANAVLAAPGFATIPVAGYVRNADELKAALPRLTAQFQAVYLDPAGIPPSQLAAMLPEIERTMQVVAPSQAFRAQIEFNAVLPYLKAQVDAGSKRPRRGRAVLKVDQPVAPSAPSASEAIPVVVRIQGQAPVHCARLIYTAPDGRVGAADLSPAGDAWKATLPPMLTGGTLTVRARAVDAKDFGIAQSEPLVLKIPTSDKDRDGLDDTMESYQESDPANYDTDRDGLPDGLDPAPTRVTRELSYYLPAIYPPSEGPLLADAGASTVKDGERVVPAGGAVTYSLPLKDLPAAQAVFRLVTVGGGTVALNGGAPVALEAHGEDDTVTDLPLADAGKLDAALPVKIAAGDKPLRVISLDLISNPEGPYVHSLSFDPAFPYAGIPIPVRAVVYDPDGVKSVRLRYGAKLSELATLELKPLDGTFNTIFVGELPPQQHATTLLYDIEATDNKGNVSAGAYRAVPVGKRRKHTEAHFGGRDLHGAWNSAPIWGGLGRELVDKTGADTTVFANRPGRYYVWMLASPRQRGVALKIDMADDTQLLSGKRVTVLDDQVPAGSPDGWYKLGTFALEDTKPLRIAVTPVGDKGYCAYGMLILTQDDRFTPPLANAGFDIANSITMLGLNNGEAVKGTLTVTMRYAGNIDAIKVTATMIGGNLSVDTEDHVFTMHPDERFTLDTTRMLPGTYRIKAEGLRLVKLAGDKDYPVLVSASVVVKLEK